MHTSRFYHALLTWLVMEWSRSYHILVTWLIMHRSRKWSCTDHVDIMHWSRGWSYTVHVSDHALITWLIIHCSRNSSCTHHVSPPSCPPIHPVRASLIPYIICSLIHKCIQRDNYQIKAKIGNQVQEQSEETNDNAADVWGMKEDQKMPALNVPTWH